MDNLDQFLASVDRSKFDEPQFAEKIPKPWGWEIKWTPDGLPYTGKILHINAGMRISLQVHDDKMETWYLLSGQAKLVRDNQQGQIEETEMKPQMGYTNQIGQKHRLIGITDIEVLEVSTPESGNTYRLEDDFHRPTETEELRREPNRGWHG